MLDTSKYGYLRSLQALAAISNPKRKGNTMKLRKIANNVTVIETTNGTEVLVSYETPVAAVIGGIYYRTSKKWSATTSKHINGWLEGITATERDQEFFDELLQIA